MVISPAIAPSGLALPRSGSNSTSPAIPACGIVEVQLPLRLERADPGYRQPKAQKAIPVVAVEVARNMRNTCAVTTDPVLPSQQLAIEDLKSPSRDTLAKPPLELVVCQVRHEPVPSVADADRVPLLQDQLSQWCDRVEPVSPLPPGLPPGMVPASAVPPSGWRFLSERGWFVTLNTDSFAVECTRYVTWTAFNELLSAVINTVSSAYRPKLTQRVGLRFVDRFSRAESALPTQWIGWLDPAVLGFGAHPTLGGATLVAQTSSELVVEGLRANIRGSIATDNTPNGYSFVLDTDCFDDRVRRFETSDISAVVDRLHDLNLRLFQTVITDDLYAEIHG